MEKCNTKPRVSVDFMRNKSLLIRLMLGVILKNILNPEARTPPISKIDFFVTIVNGFQQVTNATKRPISDKQRS